MRRVVFLLLITSLFSCLFSCGGGDDIYIYNEETGETDTVPSSQVESMIMMLLISIITIKSRATTYLKNVWC